MRLTQNRASIVVHADADDNMLSYFVICALFFSITPTLPFPPFGGNGSIAWTSAVSHVGRTSNVFKVTMKVQTFLFQMVVTSCISVQYLWKYGFAKSSDNLYAPCISAISNGAKKAWSYTCTAPYILWRCDWL